MKYFKKVIPNVFFVNGTPVAFEPAGGDAGVIKLEESPENADKIKSLEASADGRKNGIVRISAEIYEDLKKNAHLVPLRQRSTSLGGLKVAKMPEPFGQPRKLPSVVSVADADDRKPAAVQGSEVPPASIGSFRARTRRVSDIQPPPA